jgi:hypothetical protein
MPNGNEPISEKSIQMLRFEVRFYRTIFALEAIVVLVSLVVNR